MENCNSCHFNDTAFNECCKDSPVLNSKDEWVWPTAVKRCMFFRVDLSKVEKADKFIPTKPPPSQTEPDTDVEHHY